MSQSMPQKILKAVKARKGVVVSPIKVWNFPEDGKRYIIGADPSLGNQDGDNAAIEVIDADTGEQCAEFAGSVTPEELAPIILDLAKRYNNAEVAVEVNSVGMVTNNLLIRKYEYENIYRFKKLDRLTHFMTDLMGWWTNTKSLAQMQSTFRETIGGQPELIHSKKLLKEILAYDEDGFERNDRLMALMIAYAVRGERLMSVAA